MPISTPPKLLILDDEFGQMKALCDTLEPEGYAPTGFTSPADALQGLRQERFDLVVTDLMMPQMDGVEFLRAAQEADPNLVGIIMTGHGTVSSAVKGMQTGALDYILKPFSLAAVLPVLRRALEVRRLRMENIHLQQAVGIYELSMAITASLDPEVLLQKVGAAAAQEPIRDVFVLLPSPDGGELVVALGHGKSGKEFENRRFPVGEALSGWLKLSQENLLRPVEAMSGSSCPLSAPLPGLPGLISIPMVAGGRFLGLMHLNFENPEVRVVPGQLKALNILAATAASALDGAMLLSRLQAAEQKYRRLAENAPDVVVCFEVEPQPRYAYVSPAVSAAIGYGPEEFYADADLGRKIVHPDDLAIVETMLRGGYPSGSTATIRWTHRNGNTVWIEQRNMLVQDADGKLIAVESILRDVTERRQIDERLRQSQKMEALALLAGGVAHEFNNLLMVISGNTELILLDEDPGETIRQQLEIVMRATNSAAAVTRQLLAFGRRQATTPAVLDPNAVVQNCAKMLRSLVGEEIEFVLDLAPSAGLIRADAGQIEQILLNLVMNARDAMPTGGRVTIATSALSLANAPGSEPFRGAPAAYMMLSVSDTGTGMDEATRARIFEPFFTTKEKGKGTGLGLSIVYGIVQQNGGTLSVESMPGCGTTFRISLPCVEADEAKIAEPARSSGTRSPFETVLVAEDDEPVRALICAVLRHAGYQVMHASDGAKALEIYRKNPGAIRLVLSDVVMPRMDGPALIEELTRMDPSLKAIYMSGYTGDRRAARGGLDPRIPLIEKPFRSAFLLEKVREVLDNGVMTAVT